MKVLFLDFDGVLNHQQFLIDAARENSEYPMTNLDRWVSMLDPAAVARLNEVVERTNCAVVVSSSWRIGSSRPELQHMLEVRGFRWSLLGCTPSCRTKENPHRGYEIQRWIDDWNEQHPDDTVTDADIAIIDDDSDMDHLLHRLVHTGFTVGLQDEHVDALVSLLGEDPIEPS